jgi:hypothetical protein
MTHRQRLLMIVTTLVAAMGLSFAGAGVASAAPSAPAPARPVTALATPITGTTSDGGTFAGTFTPSRFSVQNGKMMATGLVTGTVKNASGATVGNVSQTVSTPAAITAASCSILNLILGPLHLNVLGLVVDLNQVILVITAVPGAGALLGNLLCAVAGLLDGTPSLGALTVLLNSILALLGAL